MNRSKNLKNAGTVSNIVIVLTSVFL